MIPDHEATGTFVEAIKRTTVTFDRRMLIRRGAALGAGLTGSGAPTWFGVTGRRSATTLAAPSTPTTKEVTTEIAAAANAFLGTLSAAEKSAGLFDWTDTAQRQRWSNLPQGLFDRAGLMWGDLSQAQQDAWLAVMQATLSTEGYTRVRAE